MIVGLLRESLFEGDELLLLCLGGLGLCVLAIVIDRFNFPQRRFRPKRISLNSNGTKRDRTGAHVIDESHRGDTSSDSLRRRSAARGQTAVDAEPLDTGPSGLTNPPTSDEEPS